MGYELWAKLGPFGPPRVGGILLLYYDDKCETVTKLRFRALN